MTPIRKYIVGAVAVGAIAAGAAGMTSFGVASAAPASVSAAVTTDTTDTSATADTSATPTDAATDAATDPATDAAADAAPKGPHSANGITEEVLTGDNASSVQAAVLAAYPDATIDRMETDAEGAAYEAHIIKADGSDATVKLDAGYQVTETLDGHG
ncbi:MAG: hypothetical protein RLZZ623_2263 [Actinomycetota bacterium]